MLLLLNLASTAQESKAPDTNILQLGLPVIVINTIDSIEPTADNIDAPEGCWGGAVTNKTTAYGRIQRYDSNGDLMYDSNVYDGEKKGMSLKLHGNWSARSIKKAYKVKLKKKNDLFCRGNEKFYDKEFLLIHAEVTNDYSPSPLTTFIGGIISRMLNLPWTPQTEYVNLIVNGDYRGLYLISESVKRNKDCRIDVDENNGFISELDPYWWNEDICIESSFFNYYTCPLKYTFKFPESEDFTYDREGEIENCLKEFEDSLDTDDGYTKCIDVDNWVRWIMAHDILGSTDGGGSNIYISKYDVNDDSTKLTIGPLWDFDSVEKADNTWASIHQWHIFSKLFKKEKFIAHYKELYDKESKKFFGHTINLHDSLSSTKLLESIDKSVTADHNRWPVYNMKDAHTAIEESKNWFIKRQSWMNVMVSNMQIPTGIKLVNIDTENCKDACKYNLLGQKINNNIYRGIVIGRNKKKYKTK